MFLALFGLVKAYNIVRDACIDKPVIDEEQVEEQVEEQIPPLENMQGGDEMYNCRVGECPAQIAAEDVAAHVVQVHAGNIIEPTPLGLVGAMYLRWEFVVESFYNPGQAYDYVVITKESWVFFVAIQIEADGDVLMDIQYATPQRDGELHYTAVLSYPENDRSIFGSSEMQRCLIGVPKLERPTTFERNSFDAYFNLDGSLKAPGMPMTFEVRVPKIF